MKTAISLDDELLREVDKTARSMGLSRSRLFAIAADDFLKRQRGEEMLRRLNEVYSGALEPAEKRLLKGLKTKFSRTVTETW
jgi:metal-responsive CopG/Arc/MetJ family transcriptional regulator